VPRLAAASRPLPTADEFYARFADNASPAAALRLQHTRALLQLGSQVSSRPGGGGGGTGGDGGGGTGGDGGGGFSREASSSYTDAAVAAAASAAPMQTSRLDTTGTAALDGFGARGAGSAAAELHLFSGGAASGGGAPPHHPAATASTAAAAAPASQLQPPLDGYDPVFQQLMVRLSLEQRLLKGTCMFGEVGVPDCAGWRLRMS